MVPRELAMLTPYCPPPSPVFGRVSTLAIILHPQVTGSIPCFGCGLKPRAVPLLAYSLYNCGPREPGCQEYVFTCLTSVSQFKSTRMRPPSVPALKKKFSSGWLPSSGTLSSWSFLMLPPARSGSPSTIVNLAVVAASFLEGEGTLLNLNSAVADSPSL